MAHLSEPLMAWDALLVRLRNGLGFMKSQAWIQNSGTALVLVSAEQARSLFLLVWTALWIYFSLGMTLLSFSAIQFQNGVLNGSNARSASTKDQQVNTGATVAYVALLSTYYERNRARLLVLEKQDQTLGLSADQGTSNAASTIAQLTTLLYPKLFSPSEPAPSESSIVDIMKMRCAATLDPAIKPACNSFIKESDSIGTPTNTNADQRTAIQNEIVEIKSWIATYESSPSYGENVDLKSYNFIAGIIFPWLPEGLLLPAVPHPLLVLSVTISMGALGSVLFMLQLHLTGPVTGYRMSISWHLFRPLQGMVAALAIYLLVRAGQISVNPVGGVTNGNAGDDLNVFALGLLGIISGLLSDRAIERLSAAGIQLLRISATGKDDGDPSSRDHDGAKPDSPSDAQQQPAASSPHDGITAKPDLPTIQQEQPDTRSKKQAAEDFRSSARPTPGASRGNPGKGRTV
jgi:hypothetical protein